MVKVPYEDKKMPFGKHRGQLIADISTPYLEFISGEDWFKVKFPRLLNLIQMELAYRKKFDIEV